MFLICASILAAAFPQRAVCCEEKGVRLPVIMYHHIREEESAAGPYVITPEVLESDLRWLREHGYTAVGTDELRRHAHGSGTLPDKPIMITFDDGQESVAVYALPLLEKYGCRAVVAVVGEFADRYTGTDDHHVAYSYMSWPQLARLAASPCIELAAHSYAMHGTQGRIGCSICPGEDVCSYRDKLNTDISMLEARFEQYIGQSPCVFAYPYGVYCAEARELLRERGYDVLLTCEERVNILKRDPETLLSLGRFNRPYGLSSEEFFSHFD